MKREFKYGELESKQKDPVKHTMDDDTGDDHAAPAVAAADGDEAGDGSIYVGVDDGDTP